MPAGRAYNRPVVTIRLERVWDDDRDHVLYVASGYDPVGLVTTGTSCNYQPAIELCKRACRLALGDHTEFLVEHLWQREPADDQSDADA